MTFNKNYKGRMKRIFGSYVRQGYHEGSDIDVLVDFESDADLIHFVGLSIFPEEMLGLKIDVVPYDAIRKKIKDSILKGAVYL